MTAKELALQAVAELPRDERDAALTTNRADYANMPQAWEWTSLSVEAPLQGAVRGLGRYLGLHPRLRRVIPPSAGEPVGMKSAQPI